MQFIKSNFIGLIAIILMIILFFTGTGKGCRGGDDTTDTLHVKTETVYVPQPPVYIPQYIPVPSGSTAPVIIPPSYQPSGDYNQLLKQYNDLVNKHLTINTYQDSIQLKDSSGKRVGVVNIKDEIQENTIKSRTPNYQLTFPHTTTTITIRDSYRQFYGGLGITGTPSEIVNGGKGEILYKTKQDKIIGIEGGAMKVGTQVTPYFGAKVYWPLGSKKR